MIEKGDSVPDVSICCRGSPVEHREDPAPDELDPASRIQPMRGSQLDPGSTCGEQRLDLRRHL